MECKECSNEVDELVAVKVGKKKVKVCEDCADRMREADEVSGAAEGAMRNLMEYKGK